MKRFAALLPALAMLLACTAFADKPNVVVMMVDNHGWGELGCYGGGILRGAPTPRLDQLANEAMRLLNLNVEPQCTPSRSAFMTGRHEARRVHIDDSLLGDDKDMLEDLVAAAINDAAHKVERTMQEKFSGLTSGMGLPGNIKLPF